MIVQEHFSAGRRDFIRTYSDSNRYVMRDGIEYEEACDPAEFGRQYTEGSLIPAYDVDSAEAFEFLFGGES